LESKRATLCSKLCVNRRICVVEARKKIGAERCEFDAHTSKKASKELKVLQLHLWRVNVKTTGGFIYMSLEDFHMDKTAP
jgi:hypothetical protein